MTFHEYIIRSWEIFKPKEKVTRKKRTTARSRGSHDGLLLQHTVNCIACLVASSRMRPADLGLEIIAERVTHSAYRNTYGQEYLTCTRQAVTFRKRWLDAVTRAMHELPSRTT